MGKNTTSLPDRNIYPTSDDIISQYIATCFIIVTAILKLPVTDTSTQATLKYTDKYVFFPLFVHMCQ